MAQTAAVVRGTLSATAAGTTDFTKASFGTPTAAIIIVCNANTTNNPQDNAVMSIGFWDGTNQVVISCRAVDNVTTMETGRGSSVLAGAHAWDAAGLTVYTVSAVTDGIRLTNSTDNTALARYATVLLLAGVSAKVTSLQMHATQNSTVTSASLGFAPKCVLVGSVGSFNQEIALSSGVVAFSFGFASIDGTHRANMLAAANAGADDISFQLYSETRCAGEVSFAGSLLWTAEVTTFGADTFTVTTRDGGSSNEYIYVLALGGDVSFDNGTLSTPTSTGAAETLTDIAADALLVSLSTAKDTTIEADADANGFMVGLADDNGQFCHNYYVEDAAAVSNTGSVASATAIIDLDTSAAGSRAELIDGIVTLNDANFSINYSAVDAAARKGWWIAFGNAVSQAPLGTVTSGGSSMFRQYFRKLRKGK